MSDRTPANGTYAEARSATALFLTLTAVIAGAIALASGLGDGDTGFAVVAGVIAAISFVIAVFCFSADAEPLPAAEPAPTALATAD